MQTDGKNEGKTIQAGALEGGLEAEQAFSAFYRDYYRRLVVFASSFRVVPESDREDAAHEILVHAFCRIASYDPGRPLRSWVYGVARNYLLDLGRRKKVVHVELDADALECIDTPFEARLEAGDLLDSVWSAIQAMPETDRRIAMLVFYEELEPSEAARALGLPAGTLRWRLMNIRSRLRALRDAIPNVPNTRSVHEKR